MAFQRFSALQRAEIAEIEAASVLNNELTARFSALQRAEIAEIEPNLLNIPRGEGFSALQRAEIAEISPPFAVSKQCASVSVLFNEPKLLKSRAGVGGCSGIARFSALQRAEIAEIARQE